METYADIQIADVCGNDDPVCQRWSQFLGRHHPHCEMEVRKAVNDWRRKARELLARETGLRMKWRDSSQDIPISVEPGLPMVFRDAIEPIDPALLYLIFNRNRVRACLPGLRFLSDNRVDITRLGPISVDNVDFGVIDQAGRHVVAILAWLDSFRISSPEIIYRVDVLGCYHPGKRRVTLFWEAIGLVAYLLGMSARHVATVVLFHELAHAWHHRGFDIDGRQWNTTSFVKSELPVLEGVAQFYAWWLSMEAATSEQGVGLAWDSLESHQSGPYLAHRDWKSLHRQLEVIRSAMVSTRRQDSTPVTWEEFDEAVKHAEWRIGQTASGDR